MYIAIFILFTQLFYIGVFPATILEIVYIEINICSTDYTVIICIDFMSPIIVGIIVGGRIYFVVKLIVGGYMCIGFSGSIWRKLFVRLIFHSQCMLVVYLIIESDIAFQYLG